MNQADSLGVALMPSNEVAGASGSTMSIWPVLALILVAGVVVLFVYKKFFE